MENTTAPAYVGPDASAQGSGGINTNFKIVQQMQTASRPSIKGLAPESKAIRELGANFDLGTKIGMTQVNTAEATKIQTGPEVGKGGLVDEVF